MSSDYDVIVLGGGSPGEHCAGALAEGAAGHLLAAPDRNLWPGTANRVQYRHGRSRGARRPTGAARSADGLALHLCR